MHLPPTWIVVVLSALPVSEVRGGILAGWLWLKMPLWQVLPLAIVACTASAIPIVLLFNWAAEWLRDKPVLGPLVRWVEDHARKRQVWVERYGLLAVILFVAGPIPGFGVWTGAPIAAMFGLKFWKAMLCMLVGVTLQSAAVALLLRGAVGIAQAVG